MSQKRQQQVVIDEVEGAVLRVFCREPDAVVIFEAPAEDILDDTCRKVVEAAQKLRRRRLEVTKARLALETGIPLDNLETWAAEVGPSMRAEFHSASQLISAAAQARRMVVFLAEAQAKVLSTPLLDIEELSLKLRADFNIVTANGMTQPHAVYVWDVFEEMETMQVPMTVIPTGIPIMDMAMRGGMRPSTFLLLAGPPKKGKTTTARNIGYHVMHNKILDVDTNPDAEPVSRRARVVHVALDGGNYMEHICDYWAMKVKEYCLAAGISTLVRGPQGSYDCVYSENMMEYHKWTKTNKRFPWKEPMSKAIIEQAELARQFFKDMREDGYFAIFDMETMGNDISRIYRLLEQYAAKDHFDLFMFDHAGKAGERGGNRKGFERLDEFATGLDAFIRSHPIVGLVISHLNQEGTKEHTARSKGDLGAGDDGNPKLADGNALFKECDGLWLVDKPTPESVSLYRYAARRGEFKAVPPATYQMYGYSGLMDTQVRSASEGYIAPEGY